MFAVYRKTLDNSTPPKLVAYFPDKEDAVEYGEYFLEGDFCTFEIIEESEDL